MKSMTGYGRASWSDSECNLEIEIRSVNSRFFKFSSRIPQEYAPYEIEIKNMVTKKISRGSVNLAIDFANVKNPSVKINTEVLKKHYLVLSDTCKELDIAIPKIESLLNLPEVVVPQIEKSIPEPLWLKTQELLNSALNQLMSMRKDEGQSLVKELQHFCQEIRHVIKKIEITAPRVIDNFKERVQQRVQQFLDNENLVISDQDILKELAIFSEKVDINEELSRLDSHLRQFEQKISIEEPVGKTLEFLTQEMLRETNTIASKANDASCSQDVVQIKTYLEKIREQIHNIE
ncbi:YicC/YloC family endoribonuclease [Candidatus Uabimicrobium sp. HlEnr_7]|uniref:YicC/YloC family endoribonuclease n=1 Tax=Candidatus Uabimicrobium helgolandensis TaxID=3095367 RepID=UPI0035569737